MRKRWRDLARVGYLPGLWWILLLVTTGLVGVLGWKHESGSDAFRWAVVLLVPVLLTMAFADLTTQLLVFQPRRARRRELVWAWVWVLTSGALFSLAVWAAQVAAAVPERPGLLLAGFVALTTLLLLRAQGRAGLWVFSTFGADRVDLAKRAEPASTVTGWRLLGRCVVLAAIVAVPAVAAGLGREMWWAPLVLTCILTLIAATLRWRRAWLHRVGGGLVLGLLLAAAVARLSGSPAWPALAVVGWTLAAAATIVALAWLPDLRRWPRLHRMLAWPTVAVDEVEAYRTRRLREQLEDLSIDAETLSPDPSGE